jgi:hypothetical protein
MEKRIKTLGQYARELDRHLVKRMREFEKRQDAKWGISPEGRRKLDSEIPYSSYEDALGAIRSPQSRTPPEGNLRKG